MDFNEIAEKVCSVIGETLGKPVTVEKLRTDGLQTLEINSMTFLMLVTAVENAFDIEFDDDEINYGMFSDFNRFCDLIRNKIEG